MTQGISWGSGELSSIASGILLTKLLHMAVLTACVSGNQGTGSSSLADL
jgi:hypothetical protein